MYQWFTPEISVLILCALSFIFSLPFGISSIWNLLKYGPYAVYEDPLHYLAYFMGFMLIFHLKTRNLRLVSSFLIHFSIFFHTYLC